jgi:hypothetical protein
MRTALLAACCLLAAPAAMAAPQGMASLRVVNAAARVVVIPEDRPDISLIMRRGRGAFAPLRTHRLGPIVVVDGGIREGGRASKPAFPGRGGCGSGQTVKVAGRAFRRADLPVIVARVPKDVRIAAGGLVFGEIGPAASLSLTTTGCGDWKVGPVAGPVDVSSQGGGRVEIAGRPAQRLRRSGAAGAGHGEESARKSLSQRP